MASADTSTDVLVRAGIEDISLHRCDIEVTIGADLDQAVEFVLALGPAGEVVRLAGSDAERRRPEVTGGRVMARPDVPETVRASVLWMVDG